MKSKFVIAGGGISGVTCAETLSALCPHEEIVLLTASSLIKSVANFRKVTKALETFTVEERPLSSIYLNCPNVKVIQKVVTALNAEAHVVTCEDGTEVYYEKLCICTGGRPKMIAEENPFVLGIRDTESAKEFQKRLCKARRIVVVGNGGIATEVVYEIEGCEVIWAVKDKSISQTFVDAGAAEFFLPHLNEEKDRSHHLTKRLQYTLEEDPQAVPRRCDGHFIGGALGPDWADSLDLVGTEKASHKVHVETQVEVEKLYTPEELKMSRKTLSLFPLSQCEEASRESADSWPVFVELTNKKIYGCDFVVSATGVVPNTVPFAVGNHGNCFQIAEDGGIEVNDKMLTSVPDVYAAGDVCTASWQHAIHWQQMRLWHQARQMGAYAAKSMLAAVNKEEFLMDFCFEIFAHVTKFFNYKVVLLGKFNAQGLGNEHELLLRVTKGTEYIKLVLQDGKLHGAVLIGETDLEETLENLILNQMDLTPFKDHLLDPNIDIEDFFD